MGLPDVPPIMIEVARCESGQKQFYPNGSLVRDGVTGTHVGIFQIGELVWNKKAKELGYNLYEAEGNIKMGLYIYKNFGTAPWKASQDCWGKLDT